MRSRYTNQTGDEAFFNEPDAQFSGTKGGTPPTATTEKNPGFNQRCYWWWYNRR